MTTLYLFVAEDRHFDPEFELHRDEASAIAAAKQWAVDYSRHGEIEERDSPGREYFATYSGESDCVYVTKMTVKERDLCTS